MIGFFRPPPDAPEQPPSSIDRLYRRWQWSVFLSIVIGYTIFYVTRLSMSVSKSALIESGTLVVEQTGVIDAVFLVTYAVGKTANGFLADRVSIRRFFATALLLSSLANLAFGLTSQFLVFAVLWAINGWVQSVGVPASGVVMASWFSTRELGTRYSIWSIAHHLGEGLTFLFSAHLIGAATSAGAGADAWRAAFIGPAALGLVSAVILYRTLADRPRSKGLPPIAEYTGSTVAAANDADEPLGKAQLAVLKNPAILLCGVASGLIYVSRWAINNWGILYLERERGYSIEEAGTALSLFPMVGIAGALAAGPLSDYLFRGLRVPVAVGYGVLFCGSLAVFYTADASPAVLQLALAVAGFAMGGLLVFLGGLLAMELCSRAAAGAALGVIGGFSYLGAGVQAVLSGYLIDGNDFSRVKWLWLGAPCLAVVITASLWRAERRAKPR